MVERGNLSLKQEAKIPNWCFNSATISHEDPAMIAKMIEGGNEGKFFDTFVPMPAELRATTSPSPTNETLVEKYGASDWYSWSVNSWGTKWDTEFEDADVSEDGKSAHVVFNTAWSPPLEFYNSLLDLGFKIDATYTEEGMGFAGHYVDGDDECVDLDFDKNSETWINEISDETLRETVMCEYENWLSWQDDEEEEENDK